MSSDLIKPGSISEQTRNYAIIVHILYIVGAFNGITTLIGVIIAYIKRGENTDEIERSHFSAAITTFWISLLATIVGYLTIIIAIGFVILGIAWIWYLYRSIIGLIRAMDYRPA